MTKKPKSDYAIQAVANALRLLQVFREEDEVGVAELARRLELPKNNVFRLLATMEELGFIEQSCASGRYRLGLACHSLGQAFTRARPLIERARPVLDRLQTETGETVHLAVRDGFEVVHLEARAPAREIAIGVRTGRRAPMHCTALGKVLLGCSPERIWREFDEQVVRRGKLPQRTDRSIDNPIKFFEHLRSVAGLGYAVDIGELEDGLGCAAAPVHAGDGELVAALSVSAPLFRVGEEALVGDLRCKVIVAAERLSASLGYTA
ncbi:MAG TPA: IclR family transcriptional regulator [Myxococcota bacterium]|nr:IclR family transcriptional regulator [Myxococcota bacterium]